MSIDDEVAPLAGCGTCNGTGMVALCGKPTDWSGPCVLRSGHNFHCHGEDDVASDWTPAATCPACQSCPDCGSRLPESASCRFCPYVRPVPEGHGRP